MSACAWLHTDQSVPRSVLRGALVITLFTGSNSKSVSVLHIKMSPFGSAMLPVQPSAGSLIALVFAPLAEISNINSILPLHGIP